MLSSRTLLTFVCAGVCVSCLATNPGVTNDDSSTTAGDSTDEGWSEQGMLGCTGGGACTFVIAAQTVDDRLEFYQARGEGPVYRGALSVDYKPGFAAAFPDQLDEPYGMAIVEERLHVLVGHYPERTSGSLVSIPLGFFDRWDAGSFVSANVYFAAGQFSSGVEQLHLAVEEPLFPIAHPSGFLLIGAIANDIGNASSEWNAPGRLLVVDPSQPEDFASMELTFDGAACTGAWTFAALDAGMQRLGFACAGSSKSIVVLDASGLAAAGTAQAAVDSLRACTIGVQGASASDGLQYLAGDGDGGLLLARTTAAATTAFRRYSAQCSLIGASTDMPGVAKQIVRLADEPQVWLAAVQGSDDVRGVHALGSAGASVVDCGRIPALDTLWDEAVSAPNQPFALALTANADGLAIGAGPIDVEGTSREGIIAFADISLAGDDPCAVDVGGIRRLTDSAPSVQVENSDTWRRAPNMLLVHEVN